jgi:hypothetical protein
MAVLIALTIPSKSRFPYKLFKRPAEIGGTRQRLPKLVEILFYIDVRGRRAVLLVARLLLPPRRADGLKVFENDPGASSDI